MAIKDLLDEVDNNVKDVIDTKFEYNNATYVPNLQDAGLTYESGSEKKGKLINTCVLFVDIRDSVALTEKHHNQTMGRIYTAFTKAILKAARYHNGHVRNIIGDRVMIVFDPEDCFTNAVDCAISINYIASRIINKRFSGVNFKCGIGVDYGELRVTKVGVERNGAENHQNKGLVWVGYPANLASRLTDNANKTKEEIYFEVVTKSRILRQESDGKLRYVNREKLQELSPEELAEKIDSYDTDNLTLNDSTIIRFKKKSRTVKYPAILITEAVFNDYKKSKPHRKDVADNLWEEQKHKIKNVKSKVYGGNIIWVI